MGSREADCGGGIFQVVLITEPVINLQSTRFVYHSFVTAVFTRSPSLRLDFRNHVFFRLYATCDLLNQDVPTSKGSCCVSSKDVKEVKVILTHYLFGR